ncbi:MAG: SUMF1/EgtB/PvdO family nonheme iron enzyme [Planctomycetaceae bacterium]|nr:SUMF1/EgtB/PvdO family nonheme iron enzyme [Planctomycetaceae bacterium]
MRALIPAVFVALLGAVPQQSPAPEKVAIPGTPVSFETVALPGVPGQIPPFRIGVKEVTWTEFNTYFESKDMASGVDAVTRPTRAISYFGQVGVPAHFLDPKRPVTNLRWHSSIAYCDWLSKKTGGYWRLPTESEWEYAARAGEAGDAPASLDDVAWHKGNSQARTHEGGEKKANAFGLHDMLGNLWEYCLEFQSGTEFAPVLKGGCWSSPAELLKYSTRTGVPLTWFEEDPNRPRSVWWLTNKDVSQGIRVVCAADPADQKERAAAAAKIEVKILSSKEKTITVDKSTSEWVTVACELKNGGDKDLAEVEVFVSYLNPKGQPHLIDVAGTNKPGQATFSKGWPVLASSKLPETAKPLKPGETRKFGIDIPSSFDSDDEVDREKFAGRATNVRFAK